MGLRFKGRKNDQNLAINVECWGAKGRTHEIFSLIFKVKGSREAFDNAIKGLRVPHVFRAK